MKTTAPKIPGKGKGRERNEKCPCGSGKKFKQCHGANGKGEPPKLVEAAPTNLVRLDLACGQNVKEGFQGVDIVGNEKLGVKAVDLWKFPWPFADNSVDELHCSHHIEHIPAREVEERDLTPVRDSRHTDQFLGQDMMFAFFDECWRIMKPDAFMHVVCPSCRSSRAFWDPTHRRFIDQITFGYFNADWRKANGLDHYRVRCNFHTDVGYSMPQEETVRAPEVQTERFNHYWNVTHDWIAKMKAIK